MNLLDVAFLAGCVLAAIGGWRLGFIRRVTGWVGLILGVTLVSRLLPLVMTTNSPPAPADLIKSLIGITIGGVAGQAVGHVVGGRLRGLISLARFGTVDSTAGTALGIAGVVVASWMIIPAMVQIPGWPAEAARGSAVAARLTRALGKPPDLLAGISKSLGVEGLPDVLRNVPGLHVSPKAPANQPVPLDTLAAAERSVVKLSGPACDRLQSGSGFVIAPGVIATNAHVVAGSESLTITTDDDQQVPGTLTYIDVRQDVALVVAPRLDRPALPMFDTKAGDSGSILGYPNGGPLKVQPYKVAAVSEAVSRDIYDRDRFSRQILVVGSRIGPGDSGGPLVDTSGRVAGIAFGIAPDDDQTAYGVPAKTLEQLMPELSQLTKRKVGSGACRTD